MKNNKRSLCPDQQRESFKKITESYFILIKIRLERIYSLWGWGWGWRLRVEGEDEGEGWGLRVRVRVSHRWPSPSPLDDMYKRREKKKHHLWTQNARANERKIKENTSFITIYTIFIWNWPNDYEMRGRLSRFLSKNLMY